MTVNYNPYASKFGICITRNTPFVPSCVGIYFLLILHLGTCLAIWSIEWPFIYSVLLTLLIVAWMINTLDRSIFRPTDYQFQFFFEDNAGWVIQQNDKPCYRAALKYAYCSQYLVILGFKEMATMLQKRGFLNSKTRMLPIFFDSLPAYEFRQLRKTLIVLGYTSHR